jgi:hypothetical protein
MHAGAAVEFPNLLRQAMIVALVLDRLRPSRFVREQVLSHLLSRECQLVPRAGGAGVEPIDHVRHPQLRQLMLFVDQPDAAGVAIALFDHCLRQHAKEPVDVGLADQQIECELDDLGLHPREAFRATALRRLTFQRLAENARILLFDMRLRLLAETRRIRFHFAIIDQLGEGRHRPKVADPSRHQVQPRRRAPVRAAPAAPA